MAEARNQSRPERQVSEVEDIFQCSICHSEMNEVSMTQCGHPFCTGCIKKWIREKQNCPQCRTSVSTGTLIDGRSFIEMKRKYKERLEQSERGQPQGQSGGMTIEDLGNILQSVMPQRDQDMRNLTDNLLSMKDQEISRLVEIKRDQTNKINELNAQVASLENQLGNELPILTERSSQLGETVSTLRDQNRQLQDKIRTFESSVTSYKSSTLHAMEQKKALEEQLRQKSKEMITVKAQFDGVTKENTHLKMQLQSTKDDLRSQKEQLEKSEITTTQMKELVESTLQQKQIQDGELEATRQECLQLVGQVRTLEMYEKLNEESSQQLQFYIHTVLPDKDSTIAQQQQNISDLLHEVAVLTQNNIPLHQHVQILQTKLKQTTQQLQQYFEEEYGTKISTLEKRNEGMKKQLTEKETELQNREDGRDELKTATLTYKKLIKENCDLKDQVRKQETQIKQLTLDNAQSKERANDLERKINFLRISSEE